MAAQLGSNARPTSSWLSKASELLGWGYFVSGYGKSQYTISVDMGCEVTRELIRNNID